MPYQFFTYNNKVISPSSGKVLGVTATPEPDTPPPPVIPSMVLYNGAMPVGPSGCYIAGRR
jgi:hypothetical protein